MINMVFTLTLLQDPNQPVDIVAGGPPAESAIAKGTPTNEETANEEASAKKEASAKEEPKYPAPGIDPINSALITSELSPPTLDVWSLALKLDPDGTYFKATLAPVAFFQSKYVPVLSNLRISAFSDPAKGKFGSSLTLGGSRMSWKYRDREKKKEKIDEIEAKCVVSTSGEYKRNLRNLIDELKELGSDDPAVKKAIDDANALLGLVKRKLPTVEELSKFNSGVMALKSEVAYLANSNPQSKDPQLKALEDANMALSEVGVSCLAEGLIAARMVSDYTNGVGFYVTGGVSGFAYVAGPRQDDPTCKGTQTPDTDDCDVAGAETYSEVAPERLASASVAATLSYFPTLQVGLWLTGGYEAARNKPSAEDLSGSVSGNLTIAWLAYVGKIRDDGYLSGLAVGASYDVKGCVSEEPCERNLLFYNNAAPYSQSHSVSPYFDIRISTKAQFRISVPIEYIRLSSSIDETDPATTMKHAWQIVPSITVGVGSWGPRIPN